MITDNLLTASRSSSIAALYHLYPERIHKLFHYLDLERKGLETVKGAVAERDWMAACEALIHYYQTHSIPGRLKSLSKRYNLLPELSAESILTDTFTFQQQTGTATRCTDGLLNWAWTPNNDREWAWFLNRHYHLLHLLDAYQQTGSRVYSNQLNRHLLDWIVSSVSKADQHWAQWRGREVALRILHWSSIFYGLSTPVELSPALRILMLSSLLDHACYLRHLHDWGANWLCREMSGLATIALCWPEFKLAGQWFNYAQEHLLLELTRQVYPDGVHKELTSHYHRVVLQDLQNFVELAELTKRPIPAIFRQRLEEMLNYLAYSIAPTGYSVLNNDSDQEDNRDLIQQSAVFYERLDWLYITEHSQAGQKPEKGPSVAFPWAGQVINRSGWDHQAHWSFFDIGPLGIHYHGHYDKLHLSLAAGGRQLLVDSGRYSYKRDHFWSYFRHSASHNVILIDGHGQGADQPEQLTPLTDQCILTPQFDFAWGQFSGPFVGLKGKAIHKRAVVYLREHYWIVVDYIESDRPRTLEPLWHFHPACTVALEHESVVSTDLDVGNLRIVPAANFAWQVKLVAGQTQPVQGWWSQQYNHREPNSTAIYSTVVGKSATFAWVLYPAVGPVPFVGVDVVSSTVGGLTLAISEPALGTTTVAVCLGQKTTIALSKDLYLRGRCAILMSGQPPLVASGEVRDRNGNILSTDASSNSAALVRRNPK